MTKLLILFVGFVLMLPSCESFNDFDIRSNTSPEEFKEKNRYYELQNVKTLDISELDFGIKYLAIGYSKNSANCEIQIIRSGEQYIIRSIESSKSKAFSKRFTHRIHERFLTDQELDLVLSQFKKCEDLPSNISIENLYMHVSRFNIQIKTKNSFWGVKWCSLGTYNHSEKYANYKKKIQNLENLLLDLSGVTPSRQKLIISKIRNSDSLRIEAFITYGLKALDTKFEFDNKPIHNNINGVGQMVISPKDTANWKNRIDVYEVRKDQSVHLINEE